VYFIIIIPTYACIATVVTLFLTKSHWFLVIVSRDDVSYAIIDDSSPITFIVWNSRRIGLYWTVSGIVFLIPNPDCVSNHPHFMLIDRCKHFHKHVFFRSGKFI